MMAAQPGQSLPKQADFAHELKAAYRLLSNGRIDPAAIGDPHRQLTRQRASPLPVVLAVQDTTELDFTRRTKVKGLGAIGNGRGRGLLQHATLAVNPAGGQVIGLLDQHWHRRVEHSDQETRRQRQSRWRESQVWADAAERIGRWGANSRLVHVGDRHSDVYQFMRTCADLGHGFVVRAMHDRYIQTPCGERERLWSHLEAQPPLASMSVRIGRRTDHQNRLISAPRMAPLSVRATPVTVTPPVNDPAQAPGPALAVWAILVCETASPRQGDPVQWMLLSTEPAETAEQARMIVNWYTQRWVIEEWHRVLKEGCRIEDSQLDDAEDIKRLAAILGPIAVWLLHLRDLADPAHPQADDPAALQHAVPRIWREVIARLAKLDAGQLTPRQFLHTIARRGGWLGRKHDSRPGWKVIWRGWYELQMIVAGYQLASQPREP